MARGSTSLHTIDPGAIARTDDRSPTSFPTPDQPGTGMPPGGAAPVGPSPGAPMGPSPMPHVGPPSVPPVGPRAMSPVGPVAGPTRRVPSPTPRRTGDAGPAVQGPVGALAAATRALAPATHTVAAQTVTTQAVTAQADQDSGATTATLAAAATPSAAPTDLPTPVAGTPSPLRATAPAPRAAESSTTTSPDAPPVDAPGPAHPDAVDPAVAEEFVRLFHAENPTAGAADERVAEVREEIARTGTYVHTTEELAFGARVAWRNSARCIGRLYWRSLHLRDRRHVTDPAEVAEECIGHLRESTRRGRIRSTITVFAPDTPAGPGPRIWNEQLVRYAGYRAGGSVLGDPRYVGFTDTARSLGWLPPSPMGHFDVLPLVVTGGREHATDGPQMTELPPEVVLEVPLSHPEHEWFAELGLRWHAVPAISNMHLEIGGIRYPTTPFNGWYMATEIGARNLADSERYDLLREVADGMGLDTAHDRNLWRDRAAVEITLAVQHSFDSAGVTLADHHGESQRFLRHVEREEAAGRSCPVDWSWIVPPISGGLTPVFHRYYDPPATDGPTFVLDKVAAARGRGCPV